MREREINQTTAAPAAAIHANYSNTPIRPRIKCKHVPLLFNAHHPSTRNTIIHPAMQMIAPSIVRSDSVALMVLSHRLGGCWRCFSLEEGPAGADMRGENNLRHVEAYRFLVLVGAMVWES